MWNEPKSHPEHSTNRLKSIFNDAVEGKQHDFYKRAA